MTVTTPSAGLAIAAGVLTILSPCILPVLPLLIGRSLHGHPWGPLALVAGLGGGFAVMGSLIGVTAQWVTGLANGLRTVALGLLLMAGLLALFPRLNQQLWRRLAITRWFREPAQVGIAGEFWLGTQLGLLWTPCAGPILGSIIVLAAVDGDIQGAFGLLLLYSFGAALPMLVIAYGGRYCAQTMLGLRSRSESLQRIGGVIVVGTAIAIIQGWDVQIQLWLAPWFPTLRL